MSLPQLTDEQVRTWSIEQKDRWWLENVYRGDMPQLTLRAACTGFLLGGVLSATNLYVGAKSGWSLGVGITSVILAFAMFRLLSRLGLAREFTILENNAMQSIATAAGYMTSPLISSLTAYVLVHPEHGLLPWWQMMSWSITLSVLGVLFAFPMKRRFINDEQQPFPEGRACGVVMSTLHSHNAAVGLRKARILLYTALASAAIKLSQAESIMEWIQVRLLGMQRELNEQLLAVRNTLYNTPDLTKAAVKELRGQAGELHEKLLHGVMFLPEKLDDLFVKMGLKVPKLAGIGIDQLTVTPALDMALIGAGGLMGIRGGLSLMIGAILNYMILVPWMAHLGEIKPVSGSLEAGDAVFGLRRITLWSLWPGVACMVIASFVAFFAKPKVLISAVTGLFGKRSAVNPEMKRVELPMWVPMIGIPVMAGLAAFLAHTYFGVDPWMCLIGLPLTFILALVAANSTALTSTTPIGATAKITQLFYGAVQPGNVSTNIATAGMTAEIVSNSSNLLMDIKPGYMLGAKPRQQAIGHIIGIFAGALCAVPLYFVLFTRDVIPGDPASLETIQSPKFPMPSVTVWKAVAEVLTKGISSLDSPHNSIIYATIIGALVGLVCEVARIATRGKFLLSPIGLGLAFVVNFQSSLAMFVGSLIFWLLGVGRIPHTEGKQPNFWMENHEPLCAGIIAGAALMGIGDQLVGAFLL